MNKILVGLIVGAVLGLIDGATAWFTPEVRNQMLGIVIGSTVKGLIAGVAAGWFARKVNNLWAGIAVGLIVQLGLSYWVAAMQDKYYFEIMVPGAIVGAIIGFATQRYGKPARQGVGAAMVAVVFALFGINAYAGDAKPAQNAAFEKLKALAGTWQASMLTPDGQKTTVEYTVTANGSVVMERQFAGEPHEMITMYAVDGDAVIATHYCSAGNQPVLRLNPAKSTANELVFDFVKMTGNDAPHINGLQLRLVDGKAEEAWGHSAGQTLRLYLKTRLAAK